MTSAKYLDSLGVSYLWAKIKNYHNTHTYSRATDGSNEILADDNTNTIQISGDGGITATLTEDATSHNAKFTIASSSKAAANGGTDLSMVTTGEKYTWNNKQDILNFDTTPTANSNNPVTSDGIFLEMYNVWYTLNKAVLNLASSSSGYSTLIKGGNDSNASALIYVQQNSVSTQAGAGNITVDNNGVAIAAGDSGHPNAKATYNGSEIATVTYVSTAISAAQAGAAMYQGAAPTTFAPTNYKSGYYWIVRTAGTYAGLTCEPGDMIFANTDSTTYNASHFDVIQTNLDIASMTNGEIDAATDQTPNPS